MMKNKYKFSTLAVAAFAGLALISCTNDLKYPGDGGTSNLTSPVTTPDVIAWSGQQVLKNTFNGTTYSASTRGVDVNANMWSTNWDCIDNVYPGLTDADLQEIKRLLSPGEYTENTIALPFANYWVQQVFKGDSKYHASDKDGIETSTEVTGSNQMDYLVAWNGNGYDHINNFNYGSNNNSIYDEGFTDSVSGSHNHEGTTLMVNMPTTGIDPNTQFGYHETWGNLNNNRYSDHYLIVEYKGHYYVGFDYHAETDRNNPGQAKNVNRDWNFTDWIVRITPAYAKGSTPSDDGNGVPPVSNPEKDDDCKNCGHGISQLEDGSWVHTSSNDKECSEGNCETGEGEGVCRNPQPQSGDSGVGGDEGDNTPDQNPGNGNGNGNGSSNKYDINHVEINLALNDVHTLPNGSNKYDIEDLVSKLSIHVRYPKDVEVVIPVPASIYCDQDDLYILNNHYQGNYVYGGEHQEFSIPVGNGNTVTLTVEYVSPANDELTEKGEGYIRVWTTGINEGIIQYCRDNFGDGINFEVYNYYNRGNQYSVGNFVEISYDELQWKYLSRSFVNFDWQQSVGSSTKTYPVYFVNAFNSIAGNYNPGDCYVWIMGDERANNGNKTYVNNGNIFRQGVNAETVIWGEGKYSEKSYFHNAYQGYHYNGSQYNWIHQLQDYGTVEPSKNAMPTTGNWPFSTTDNKQELP